MKALRAWAEEHWIAVGLIASVGGALTFSVILAFVFNVIMTRAAGGI